MASKTDKNLAYRAFARGLEYDGSYIINSGVRSGELGGYCSRLNADSLELIKYCPDYYDALGAPVGSFPVVIGSKPKS